MVPQVIIFDLGKVLVEFDYTIAARKVAQQCANGLGGVMKLLTQPQVLYRFESGQTTKEEFFDEVRQLVGYTGSFEEFAIIFADIFTEIPAMVGLPGTLRRAGYRTGILSNTNELAVRHIRQHFPFFADFDGYVLSYEVKAMKPAARIYEAAEAMTGCRGQEILYLDDVRENVDGGAARGWQVIHHQTPQQTLPAMRALGLPV